MEWFNACENQSVITSQYADVPALNPFPISYFELDPNLPYLTVQGYLSRLPDRPIVAKGQVPDKTELVLSFLDLSQLNLSGVPTPHTGELHINKDNERETRFEYKSETFRMTGCCERAVINGVGILTTFDPDHAIPKKARLYSHDNLWNSCLVLLKEYGYTLRVVGNPTRKERRTALRWHAVGNDGVELSGNTPIELLGLASLHRDHAPTSFGEYWWKIDGPNMIEELITEWQQRTDPTIANDSVSGIESAPNDPAT